MNTIQRIIGSRPLNEAFSEKDLINAIMGCGEDVRKGLETLKKSQLKKMYRAMCPDDPMGKPEDGEEKESGSDEKPSKESGDEKPKEKDDDKKENDGKKKDDE
jgi:hypothetical protein